MPSLEGWRTVGQRQPGIARDANGAGHRGKLGHPSPREEDGSTAGGGAVSVHDSEDGVIIVGIVVDPADPGLVRGHDVREGRNRSECEDDEDIEREPQRRRTSRLRSVLRGPSSI